MANSPDNSSLPDVPSGADFSRVDSGYMPPEQVRAPPEKWDRIQALFAEMIESGDPEEIARIEPDREVAEAAVRLWRNHQEAEQSGFLNDPVTLVRDLSSPTRECFSPGRTLAGRFAIERLLGAGGMGEVYLARDLRLDERVALKTIRFELSAEPAVRRRFLSEVQNARRVTHPNVCRIFDLFEEGGVPFFSMEYLQGVRLSDKLREGIGTPEAARSIALELAEGLAAAHRSGIVHCDFKPANVILTGDPLHPRSVITDFGLARALFRESAPPTNKPMLPDSEAPPAAVPAGQGPAAPPSLIAGTQGYMAPELAEGVSPNIRSDIYAYGKVLSELLPGHRLAGQCQAQRPADRPASLERIIREFRGGSTRRWWLAGIVGAPVAALAAYKVINGSRPVLSGSHRVVVNGFRSTDAGRADALRGLLITALRESPVVTVVADDHVRALLRAQKVPGELPADRLPLLGAALRDHMALVLEGTLYLVGSGLRVLLQVFEPGVASPLVYFSEEIADMRRLVQLADRAAMRLRREFGESTMSMRSAHTPLDQVTSASPEAVDAYYRGVREYESAGAKNAEALFDQAIQIDPQFALAHLRKGMALAARSQTASAVGSYERALALRSRVTQREQLWIECRYYNIVGDHVNSLERSRRLLVNDPEEATYLRNAAFACVRIGRPLDALPFSAKAVELDPNDNNVSELIANHTDANLCDEALALYRQFRATHSTTLLDWGNGLAYMGKGDYDQARLAFERMAISPERERWSKLLRCGPLALQGRFAEAASALASDLAYDIATGEQNRRHTRRVWLGMLDWLMDAPGRAVAQAEELARLDESPVYLQVFREGGLLALLLGEQALALQFVERLRGIERRWTSTHSRGARAHLEGALLLTSEREKAGTLLTEGRGLWPDPLTLLSVAEWQAGQRDYTAALTTYDAVEQQRGRILRHYFPALVVIGWIGKARCLASMSHFSESRRLYQRVLNHWGEHAATYRLVTRIRGEYQRLPSKEATGDKNG